MRRTHIILRLHDNDTVIDVVEEDELEVLKRHNDEKL